MELILGLQGGVIRYNLLLVINNVSNHDHSSCSCLIAEELRCRPGCTKVTDGEFNRDTFFLLCNHCHRLL